MAPDLVLEHKYSAEFAQSTPTSLVRRRLGARIRNLLKTWRSWGRKVQGGMWVMGSLLRVQCAPAIQCPLGDFPKRMDLGPKSGTIFLSSEMPISTHHLYLNSLNKKQFRKPLREKNVKKRDQSQKHSIIKNMWLLNVTISVLIKKKSDKRDEERVLVKKVKCPSLWPAYVGS